MKALLKKLTSRKFLVALISIITGVLGVIGANDSTVQAVSSIGLILIPAIIYIATEGKIDAAALQKIDLSELLTAIKTYITGSADTVSAKTSAESQTVEKEEETAESSAETEASTNG